MSTRLRRIVNRSTSFDEVVETISRPRVLFALALLVRIVALPLSVFRINPYAQADATGFATVASIIANNFLGGTFSTATRYHLIYEIWGSVLAPFWFLPVAGPLLARIFVALLGACCVWNTVLITRRLSTPTAGLLAGLPLVFYPSIVLVQSSLLREAAVLFGVTTAARLLLIVSDHDRIYPIFNRPRLQRVVLVAIATAVLLFATILREDNAPLYALAILAGLLAYYLDTRWGQGATALTVGGGLVGVVLFRGWLVQRFNFFRSVRSRGRTVYFGGVRFHNLLDLFAFSIVSSGYFLFAPFPWMVGSALDIPVLFEGVGNILYALAALAGIVVAFKRDRVATAGLGVFFIAGVTLYGLGTANYGTGVRHRQMFLWVLFVFGAVGVQWAWEQYAPSRWKASLRAIGTSAVDSWFPLSRPDR